MATKSQPDDQALRPPMVTKPNRKLNILLAAEKLFARHGFHAVALRDIAEEAQVPPALLNYYFGSKEDLYRAIFEHWSPTFTQRLSQLQEAMLAPAAERLERVVDAFAGPVIRLRASAEGEHYALLASRGLALQGAEEDQILREFFDPVANKFIDALNAILSAEFQGITRQDVAWCYQFALGALMHYIGDQRIYRLSLGENQPADPAVAPQLKIFIADGIRSAARAFAAQRKAGASQ
ncbi:MAG TPA: TetR family transcriptional regulator [Ramlibacter sp.]|nr:TetR family transcriptional regulator [Ramlibacter sp.]